MSHLNSVLLVYDLLSVNVALYAGLLLRFGSAIPARYLSDSYLLIAVTTTAYLLAFAVFHMYDRVWRYASFRELFLLSCSILSGAVGMVGILWIVDRTLVLPRSVIALQFFISGGMVGGIRLFLRAGVHERLRNRKIPVLRRRALIVGGGDAGALIIKELQKHRATLGVQICGIIDDDPHKLGREIYGVKVLDTTANLKKWIRQEKIDDVIIAMPSAPGTAVRRILQACEGENVQTRILPGLYELATGEVSVSHLREVRLEDLLRREPIHIDTKEVSEYLTGKRVMVTGGAGSIGSELCRQIARFDPEFIMVFDYNENALYKLELEMKNTFPRVTFLPVIGSIQDTTRLDQVFRQFSPQVVFHAAAHKHVPMMEHNPGEAIKNNIFGTKNVAEAADRYGVEKFVLISTDKAVNPTNVMGATKRAAEMVIESLNDRSKTQFVAVRFGNVLGSNGSVVPLFKKQIEAGGPVTVTHPEVTRYFMTIPEACQLVLQAGAIGRGGEVMVLDMGEPVKIDDLARDLIRFSGLEPGKDIEIRYIGLRPGEKLYEELLADEENTTATKHKKIFTANLSRCDESLLAAMLGRLRMVADSGDGKLIRQTLQELVDTYHPVSADVTENTAAAAAEGTK